LIGAQRVARGQRRLETLAKAGLGRRRYGQDGSEHGQQNDSDDGYQGGLGEMIAPQHV
jgi:hypothetical protein